MRGIRTSARATIVVPKPEVAYVVSDDNGSSFWKGLWVAGHGFAPVEMSNARLNVFTDAKKFSTPAVSPDGTKVLYGTVPQSGSINTVEIRDVDDTNNVVLATYANGNAGGVNAGMAPFWHPDGDKVIYVESVGVADTSQNIRRVNIDGTGDVSLVSFNRSANGYASHPAYNFDGSRIAFYAQSTAPTADKLYTMLSDGSGLSNFASRAWAFDTPISWARTQDKLCWYDDGDYLVADGDGSNIDTIWTDPDPAWGNTRFAWLPDDSGIVVTRYVSTDPDPKYILTVLDPAGGGNTDISPERRTYGGQENGLPRVFGSRIWWGLGPTFDASDTDIVSVAADGSDYTVEDTITDVGGEAHFDGFDGREF